MSDILEERLPERAVTLTRELIRMDTTTGTPGESDALKWIANLFTDRPDYLTFSPIDENGNPTALVVLPAAPASNELLLLSGHTDVVPAASEEWTQDPWEANIVGGELFGRGSSDMKSGVGVEIAAFLEAGPTAPVALGISIKEEWGCAGTTDVLDALQLAGIYVPARDPEPAPGQLRIGAILVAEPTDGKLVLGHKGPLWIDVTVKGEAAHGSTPDAGVSAIFAAAELLLRAKKELPLREVDTLGKETLNVGLIEGGSARNVVADTCVVSADMRTVIDDTEELLDWWRSQPLVTDVSVFSYEPWVWTDPDHPWIKALPVAPESGPVQYGTEAAPLCAGLDSPPALIWGPGEIATMHKIDEKTSVAAIEQMATYYYDAIVAWGRHCAN